MLSTVNRHLVTRRHKVTGPESPSLFFSLSPGQRQRSVQFFWSRWPPSSSTRRENTHVSTDERSLRSKDLCPRLQHVGIGLPSDGLRCTDSMPRWNASQLIFPQYIPMLVHHPAQPPPDPDLKHTQTRTKKKKPRLWITSHRRIFTSTLSHQSRSFMTI